MRPRSRALGRVCCSGIRWIAFVSVGGWAVSSSAGHTQMINHAAERFNIFEIDASPPGGGTPNSNFCEGKARLALVFPVAVFIRDRAIFIGFEKEYLADPLVDVNAKRQVSQIRDLDDQTAGPASFQRSCVH